MTSPPPPESEAQEAPSRGRPESDLDPDAGPAQAFAARLRALREQAGRPSYRSLAAIANYSTTTLSQAAAGHDLPSLEVTLAYVRACGGGGDREWAVGWHEAARACRGQLPAAGSKEPKAIEDSAPTAVRNSSSTCSRTVGIASGLVATALP